VSASTDAGPKPGSNQEAVIKLRAASNTSEVRKQWGEL